MSASDQYSWNFICSTLACNLLSLEYGQVFYDFLRTGSDNHYSQTANELTFLGDFTVVIDLNAMVWHNHFDFHYPALQGCEGEICAENENYDIQSALFYLYHS